MTENKNICEEIEIALYSDAELTDNQKKHIESCENCRSLLSQITKMKSDLGTISVPGIEKGQITKAVMEQISKEKMSVPFPKFKLTHHLGTAAAVVIILVAVLIMKNPSEPDFENESGDAPVTFSVPDENNHAFGAPVIDEDNENNKASSTQEAADGKTTTESDNTDEALVTDTEPEAANTVLRALPKASKNTLSEDAENGAYENETATNAPVVYSVYSDEEAVEEAAPKAYSTEDGAESEGEDLMMYAPKKASASGGSSAAQGSYEESTTEDYAALADITADSLQDNSYDTGVYPESEKEDSETYIFEGIEFSKNDADFESNVSLANARLKQLYGDGYILSVEKLKKLGVDNKKLLELAPTVTDEMFHFYSGLLDIFE